MSTFIKKPITSPSDVFDEVLYKGLEGVVMKTGHRLLEIFSRPTNTVFEIGPGSQPHWKSIKQGNFKKYIVLDTKTQLDKLDQIGFPENCTLIKIPLEDKDSIIKLFINKVDRIYINHVFEHVDDPESLILWCASLLADNGDILIGLPCDPGLLWRLGQLISMNAATKKYGYRNKAEKDLMWSRNHINAIQRLRAIFNAYFLKSKTFYFPALIPSINLNLLCIIKLDKKDFYNK